MLRESVKPTQKYLNLVLNFDPSYPQRLLLSDKSPLARYQKKRSSSSTTPSKIPMKKTYFINHTNLETQGSHEKSISTYASKNPRPEVKSRSEATNELHQNFRFLLFCNTRIFLCQTLYQLYYFGANIGPSQTALLSTGLAEGKNVLGASTNRL